MVPELCCEADTALCINEGQLTELRTSGVRAYDQFLMMLSALGEQQQMKDVKKQVLLSAFMGCNLHYFSINDKMSNPS